MVSKYYPTLLLFKQVNGLVDDIKNVIMSLYIIKMSIRTFILPVPINQHTMRNENYYRYNVGVGLGYFLYDHDAAAQKIASLSNHYLKDKTIVFSIKDGQLNTIYFNCNSRKVCDIDFKKSDINPRCLRIDFAYNNEFFDSNGNFVRLTQHTDGVYYCYKFVRFIYEP